MRPDKTKAQQRETGDCDGGRVVFCVRLLYNIWQRVRVFAVFHTDNHLLTQTVTIDMNRSVHAHTDRQAWLEIRSST